MTPLQAPHFEALVRRLHPGARLLRAQSLKGGFSPAQMTALEIEGPDGRTQALVVRQYGRRDVLAAEFQLLQILQPLGLAAPPPRYLDLSCELLSTPCMVVDFIEGRTEFKPADTDAFLRRFAAHLARIHAVDGARADLCFLPETSAQVASAINGQPRDEPPADRRIRQALRAVWPLPERNAPALLHGDFWPGNVLWREGEIVGVIDWEDAARGEPLADLATSRLEILWALGAEAMEQFTAHYGAATGIDAADLPFWDLFVALRRSDSVTAGWAADSAAAEAMHRGRRFFVERALARL